RKSEIPDGWAKLLTFDPPKELPIERTSRDMPCKGARVSLGGIRWNGREIAAAGASGLRIGPVAGVLREAESMCVGPSNRRGGKHQPSGAAARGKCRHETPCPSPIQWKGAVPVFAWSSP